jgi:hypothetical protein
MNSGLINFPSSNEGRFVGTSPDGKGKGHISDEVMESTMQV